MLKRAPAAVRSRSVHEGRGRLLSRITCADLLDLTDNRVGEQDRAAARRSSGMMPDDPYLVVAADKGTATFSDYANAASVPSMASGWTTRLPPAGRLATTTRRWASLRAERGNRSSATSASWASTRRRPTSRWLASATCPVTSSAMACCCRAHIRLVAAFDHRHIFLDPGAVSPRRAWRNAKRLFAVTAIVVGRLRQRS